MIDGDDDIADALGIPHRFPLATQIDLDIPDGSLDRLDACLAALPDHSWPMVKAVCIDGYDRNLPASMVEHTARLFPGLREIRLATLLAPGGELAAALEGLAAVAPTLEVLSFWVMYVMGDTRTGTDIQTRMLQMRERAGLALSSARTRRSAA